MRMITAAIPSVLFAMSLQTGLANEASAASPKQRGYTTCYGTPDQCMRGYRAARPTPRQAPRGYRPAQRGGREYDFPRFGSKRWWQQEGDRY
jgi:hypothetical protein